MMKGAMLEAFPRKVTDLSLYITECYKLVARDFSKFGVSASLVTKYPFFCPLRACEGSNTYGEYER